MILQRSKHLRSIDFNRNLYVHRKLLKRKYLNFKVLNESIDHCLGLSGSPCWRPFRFSNLCAGINRHVVGDERALQERSSEPS